MINLEHTFPEYTATYHQNGDLNVYYRKMLYAEYCVRNEEIARDILDLLADHNFQELDDLLIKENR